MSVKNYPVVIPAEINPRPNTEEMRIVQILANHFKTSVEFLIPNKGYRQKTPDIVLLGLLWEIKSPRGSSRNTIEYQFKAALKQSSNVVISGAVTRLSDSAIKTELRKRIKMHKRVNRVLFVSKQKQVIELYRK